MPLRWIFRMFRPKNVEEAALFKLRFSMLYAFIGWNFGAIALYTIYREHIPADKDAQRAALLERLSRKRDIRYIRVDKTSVVEDRIIPKSGDTSRLTTLETKEDV
ncbi:uncharacterized protein LOC128894165 [Hylaeus anthracinus]|uniref:uncharacterized protein LOC128894165 n=1 Tax=Hylaeus anthracinus TaxID=313031 RepID=UPI0023B9CF03|nr:uncharacterized protein LOC128894165 [Hylaeus anthracinus]